MTTDLQAVMTRLAERRSKVPAESLQPKPPTYCKPDCPHCGGIGFVRRDRELNDPLFGKLEPCPNLTITQVYGSERFGLSEKELQLTWDDVSLDTQPLRLANLAIFNAIKRSYGWVYLWGSYGSAKSLMLRVAISDALRERKDAAYVRMAHFINHLRSAYDQNNPNTELQARLDWWTNVPILAIDEIEKVNLTDFAKENMFLLFDQRYENATRDERGVTLMASNLPPSSLDGYLSDRIRDGRFTVLELTGDSIRPTLRSME